MRELWVVQLGRVEYREAYALQERLRAARIAEQVPDVLLLLEHPPVYTRGRRSDPEELPLGEAFYREQGIELVDVDRGGRVTYHGPGQLVGYPIMHVDDVHAFVRTMERAIVATLADHGVTARLRTDEGPDFTGVWVGPRKVASIGIHIRKRVSTHGFAINVDNDLAPFGWVVACGLPDVAMTSVAEEAGDRPELLAEVRASAARRFAEAYGATAREVAPEALEQALATTGGSLASVR